MSEDFDQNSFSIFIYHPSGRVLNVSDVLKKFKGLSMEHNWSWDDIAATWNQLLAVFEGFDIDDEDVLLSARNQLDAAYPGWGIVGRVNDGAAPTFIHPLTSEPIELSSVKTFSFTNYEFVKQVCVTRPGTNLVRIMLRCTPVAPDHDALRYNMFFLPLFHLHHLLLWRNRDGVTGFSAELGKIFAGHHINPDSSIRILHLNAQGAGNSDFPVMFMQLIRENNPSVVMVVETRVSGETAARIRSTLGFDSSHSYEGNVSSRKGGIWILWKRQQVTVDILPYGNGELHAVIKVPNRGV